MPRKTPLVIGHRGAPGYRPEHSRSSYELAFTMGVDAVEPDVVATRDGVLVVRHENEISGTTDVAQHPEFADRRTTKRVDGESLTGWFTEDFTWEELSRLRVRERLAKLRPDSARHDDTEGMLRLSDLLALVDAASEEQGREIGVVLEVKHPTFFASIGIDLVPLIERDLRAAGWADGTRPLIVECFESTVLGRLRAEGIRGTYVFLVEASGQPFDQVALHGAGATSYAEMIAPDGLDALAGTVDGISVSKKLLLAPGNTLVRDAHDRGLQVFTWTCRPENSFLSRQFRGAGGKAAFGDYAAEWAAIAAQGVDGVFVDHPDLGVAIFRG